MMAFDSLAALADMNGHGPYVWAAYAAFFAVVLWNLWQPVQARTRFLKDWRARLARAASDSDASDR